MKSSIRQRCVWGVLRLVRLYVVLLGILLVLRLGVGDRSPWSFAVNAFFLYAFLPLPLILIAGALVRRLEVFVVFALSASVWAFFWGALFLPQRDVRAKGPRLVVLVYNALGYNLDAEDTLRVIRDSAADLVALQELNPETAAAIERVLGDVYPYRWLNPQIGVLGGGLFSKYPLGRSLSPASEVPWTVTPMAIELLVDGTHITVVGFHADPGPHSVQRRQQQAQALAEYARRRKTPLLLVGDLNATDQNAAYALIAEPMRDAWREAGWGFGHTFPGRPTSQTGGSRPVFLGVPVPMWLVRIDYIFHSPDLLALDATLAPDRGRSDHRGVMATFAIK